MDDTAGADEVDFARRVDQTGGEDVEVVGDPVDDDGVAGIVPSGSSTHHRRRGGQDIDQLAFAFVAPLRAQDECDGHLERIGGGATVDD